ncbi:hemolysin family protein [Luteococcus sp. H138]|uniref:hemolysin family protein n=1 Tax=unclassified Luteococcus TaxID=2639923 RepID=UPI00313DF1F6
MSGTLLLLVGGLLAILLIIAANGYFVAQEFAYMSVDRNRLTAQANAGDKAAGRALEVTRRTSFMLSGAQLGITVTGLLIGYVAEPMVGRALGELLGGAGVSTAVSVSVGTVGALALATLVQMLLGELYPKNLAIANPDPLARGLARSTLVYLKLFGWLVSLFDKAANRLLRLVGIEPLEDLDSTANAEDLERIVSDSRNSGDLTPELSTLLGRILDFPDRDVDHAMIPLSRVSTLRPTMTAAEALEQMATGHTRYPVIGDEQEPLGVLQLNDALRVPAAEREQRQVAELMRAPVVVPTLMPLPNAVQELDRAGQQMALVVDEYGGFTGIVTLEDLAEELIGEITDEHDDEPSEQITSLADDGWQLDGDVHLDEVERLIDRPLPSGDYETVAGLLIAHRRELLQVGDVVMIELPPDPESLLDENPTSEAARFEVLGIGRHVPDQVTLRLVEVEDRKEDQP